jgi:hypothetical protein
VGAQQRAVVEVERVVHGPRRMVRGNVERLEVVVVVLDLGPRHDRVTGAGEDLFDAQHRLGDRVQPAAALASPRQSDVDALGRQRLGELGRREAPPGA